MYKVPESNIADTRWFEFEWQGTAHRILPMAEIPPMKIAAIRAETDPLRLSYRMLEDASVNNTDAMDAIREMPIASFNDFLVAYRDHSLITEGESSASGS